MTAYGKRTNKSQRRKKCGDVEDEKNHIFLYHDIQYFFIKTLLVNA